jgi:hypothetical protein
VEFCGPSSLKKITEEVKTSGAKTIFSPAAYPNKTLKRISKSTGLPISKTPLYGEGIAADRNAVSTATINVCTIVNGQGGSCDISGAKKLNSNGLLFVDQISIQLPLPIFLFHDPFSSSSPGTIPEPIYFYGSSPCTWFTWRRCRN